MPTIHAGTSEIPWGLLGTPKSSPAPRLHPSLPSFGLSPCLSLLVLSQASVAPQFWGSGSPALLSLPLPPHLSQWSHHSVALVLKAPFGACSFPQGSWPPCFLCPCPLSPRLSAPLSLLFPFSVFAGLWVSDPPLALMALCLELLKQCEWWGVRVGPESARRLAAARLHGVGAGARAGAGAGGSGASQQRGKEGGARLPGSGGSGGPSCSEASALVA